MTGLQEKINEINERIKQMDEDLVSIIISKLEEIECRLDKIEEKLK